MTACMRCAAELPIYEAHTALLSLNGQDVWRMRCCTSCLHWLVDQLRSLMAPMRDEARAPEGAGIDAEAAP